MRPGRVRIDGGGKVKGGGKHPVLVQTVDKAAQILYALAQEPSGVGVTDLARRVRVNPSTVYRILSTLCMHHLVEQDPVTSAYRLGLGVLRLSSTILQSMELRRAARPVMERLRDETGETVNLMVLDGTTGVYVESVESHQSVRKVVHVGTVEALHCSAVGKAILAFLEESRLEEILARGLQRFTPNTITSADALKDHLAVVRGRGYAIDDEEGEVGTRCVGAPIFGLDGRVTAALSVSGPSFRLTRERLELFSRPTVEAAARISAQIGYAPR